MNKLTRISATVASSVALVAGFAGVAGAATIDRTGFSSDNRITHRNEVRTRVNNDNQVRLTNNNPQTAVSGDAEAEKNTTGGNVHSGEAMNDSFVDARVHLDNSGSTSAAVANHGGGGDMGAASISQTGAESSNVISSRNSVRTTVNNDNHVSITNNNSQTAVSGDADAEKNTTAGDVMSGDASNVSTSTFEVSVSN